MQPSRKSRAPKLPPTGEQSDNSAASGAELPLEFFDHRPLLEISPERWKLVFAHRDPPPGVDRDDPSHEAIVKALSRSSIPPEYLDMLQTLHDLGSSKGAEALHEAAVDYGIARDEWPDDPRELAVHLWSLEPKNPRIATVLVLAQFTLHERAGEQCFREFAGKSRKPCDQAHGKKAALEAELRRWFENDRLGTYVEVKSRPEDDGFSFCIFHGGRHQTTHVVREGKRQEIIRFQPAQCDTVRYEDFACRLRITARSERLVDEYRRLIGAVVFDDEEFFSGENICTLLPLLSVIDQGAFPTSKRKFGIENVRLADCLWSHGNGFRLRLHAGRGQDCLEQIRAMQMRLSEGEIIEAKLDFSFLTARRVERVAVTIKVPNRIECKKPQYRADIDEYLSQIGVRLDNGDIAKKREDLWTLAGGVHHASRWRSLCGDRLPELVDRGLLQEGSVSAAVDPLLGMNAPAAFRVRDIETVQGAFAVAGGDDGDLRTRVINPEALVGYMLDELKFAEAVAKELGCQASVKALAIAGVFDLGRAYFGKIQVHPFLVTREPTVPAKGLVDAFHAFAASQEKPVVIVPEGRTLGCGFPEAYLRSIMALSHPLRCEIVRALRIESDVPIVLRVPHERRLIIDAKRTTAWLDGIELILSEQSFEFLRIVADEALQERAASTELLIKRLPGWGDSLDRPKQAKKVLIDAIKNSFKQRDLPPPEDLGTLIQSQNRGYRLTIIPYIE